MTGRQKRALRAVGFRQRAKDISMWVKARLKPQIPHGLCRVYNPDGTLRCVLDPVTRKEVKDDPQVCNSSEPPAPMHPPPPVPRASPGATPGPR